VLARDRALEDIHINAQLETADQLRKTFTQILMAAKGHFGDLRAGDVQAIDRLDSTIRMYMAETFDGLMKVMIDLRARSYVLSRASEAEIIAQLSPGRSVRSTITTDDVTTKAMADSMAGGPMSQRLRLYLDRLRRRIVNQVQSAAMGNEKVDDFLFSVLHSFPRPKVMRRPPRALKPKLMEADGKPKMDMAIGLIDDARWTDMLDAYKRDVIPRFRGPEFIVNIPTTEKDTWYVWEFERDLTNEFVKSVRTGQIAAANENGITDFVWIAVIDSKTDECCQWRDGLLISEIRERLGDHRDEDEACNIEGDNLTPPIHFNCRCTLAPAAENIPDKPDTGAKSFDEWLET